MSEEKVEVALDEIADGQLLESGHREKRWTPLS